MSDAFNYHGLFLSQSDKAFFARLEVDARTLRVLEDATQSVKDRLRPVLQTLAEGSGVPRPYSVPQFRPQGSSVYKTQNLPAHMPEQQVDVDLGVYMSAAFMDNAVDRRVGKAPAKALAKSYFDLVDHQLKKLCSEKNWKYADGQKRNQKCCRIDLSPEGVSAHIDVPLYAAPNEQFERAVIAFSAVAVARHAEARTDLSPDLDDNGWSELEVVVMATRDGTWVESDVQKTIQHFQQALKANGHPFVLRRIWRYIKAWRDYKWRSGGGPSSVLLMEIVYRVVQEFPQGDEDLLASGRDDVILRRVFSRLHAYLASNVVVAWASEPEDLNGGNEEQRQQWSAQAAETAFMLERAATEETLSFDEVIALVRACFGQRIPTDITLIRWLRTATSLAYGGAAPIVHLSPQARVQRTAGS